MLNQLPCGVHTENGLDIGSNNVVLSSNSGKSKVSEDLIELHNLTNSFMEAIVSSMNTKENISGKITSILEESKKLLSKTIKQSYLLFYYETNEDMLRGQTVILNLAIHCFEAAESSSTKIRNLCLEIIKLCLERSEFNLNTLSLVEDLQSDILSKRLEICGKYLEFLTKLLDYSLKMLARRVHDNEIKEFVEYFLSLAYFRLPIFRRAFLQVIHPDGGKKVYNQNIINSTIDWEVLFHEKLEKYPSIDTLKISENLNKIIKDVKWEERVAKKGLCFLSITKHLVQYIERKIVIEANIQWKDIPGFDVLINELQEMIENKEMSKFFIPMTETLCAFISDPSICNTFIKLIISKTKFLNKKCLRHKCGFQRLHWHRHVLQSLRKEQ